MASFDATGIQGVGHFIHEGGNNFWGVALAEDQDGDRIVLASDRDFGLYIFRTRDPSRLRSREGSSVTQEPGSLGSRLLYSRCKSRSARAPAARALTWPTPRPGAHPPP